MKKKEHITSYLATDIAKLQKSGADLTDWNRLDALSESELEDSIDKDNDINELDWKSITIGMPSRKREVHIRLDADLLDWLKQNGRGYQTRINAILRAYMQAHN
ncbi:MAG: BrnA antitoxin family protein [Pseudomonadota bacterium]